MSLFITAAIVFEVTALVYILLGRIPSLRVTKNVKHAITGMIVGCLSVVFSWGYAPLLLGVIGFQLGQWIADKAIKAYAKAMFALVFAGAMNNATKNAAQA